eukprot:UN17364
MNVLHFAPSLHIFLLRSAILLINISYLAVLSAFSRHFSVYCFAFSSLNLSVHLGTMYCAGISLIPSCVKSLNMWQHSNLSLANFAHWHMNVLLTGSTNTSKAFLSNSGFS